MRVKTVFIMLACLLLVSMVFSSCVFDTTSAILFDGTWKCAWFDGNREAYFTYIFSGSNLTLIDGRDEPEKEFAGTFTYTATTITVTLVNDTGFVIDTWTQGYVLASTYLDLLENNQSKFPVRFYKQ